MIPNPPVPARRRVACRFARASSPMYGVNHASGNFRFSTISSSRTTAPPSDSAHRWRASNRSRMPRSRSPRSSLLTGFARGNYRLVAVVDGGTGRAGRTGQWRSLKIESKSEKPSRDPKIPRCTRTGQGRATLFGATTDQKLMPEKQRFGNDGTNTTGAHKPGKGDDQLNSNTRMLKARYHGCGRRTPEHIMVGREPERKQELPRRTRRKQVGAA